MNELKKVLVVGMNPSTKQTLKGRPNATFKKLEAWMTDCEVKYFSFVNTFDDSSNATVNKVDYQRLCQLAQDYDKIVALGGFVSSALSKINISHFKLPHPSPRNRLLNDKSHEQSIVNQCKEYINE